MSFDKNSITFLPKPTVQNFADIEGQRFERLTALGIIEKRGGKLLWLCQCDCGNTVSIPTNNLRNGHTRSCGCLRKETTKQRSITHGMTETTEYVSYCHAKARCTNPNDKRYNRYGERGIEFRFQSFEEMLNDIGLKPSPELTLNRIDNDGHYEKGNVAWGDWEEQNNNRSDNVRLTYNGKTQTQMQWSRELNIHRKVLERRRQKGWSDEQVLGTPYVYKKHYPQSSTDNA